MIDLLQLILISFASSAAFCWMVLLTEKFHSDFTSGTLTGPQTVHAGAVPRVGGVGIMIALVITLSLADEPLASLFRDILFAASLVFAAGTLEDVTGRVSPKIRLIFSGLTGIAFIYFSGVTISHVGIEWIDGFLSWWPLAAFLTIMAIASLINGVNIIDGLNGLSIGTCCFMAMAVAYLAHQEGDMALFGLALIYTAALAGIGIFNFPFGRIFAGDGGAYLMGGIIAMLVILLSERNENLSAFASLIIIIYPFYELSRSAVRRLLIGKNAMLPDSKHLHSLIYHGHMQRWNKPKTMVNYLSALMALSLPAFCSIWALFFADSVLFLTLGIFIFIASYETLFRIYSRPQKN